MLYILTKLHAPFTSIVFFNNVTLENVQEVAKVLQRKLPFINIGQPVVVTTVH